MMSDEKRQLVFNSSFIIHHLREMSFDLPKLYPITDRRLSGLTHAEQVARLCEGGARLVQLREKRLPAREFHAEASEALRVAHSFGARLIINDRADVALLV